MKNRKYWRPTKYVYRRGRLAASRDVRQVSASSRLITDRVATFYEQTLPTYARAHLLDLGCGKAPLYIAYKELVSEVTCVDWGNSLHHNEHLDVECDLTEDLPFSDETFDTIILSDVLEHIPEPAQLCKEMSRVLSPGGTLIMNVPFLYWLHETPYDYYRYTEFALRRLIEHSGMRLIQLDTLGGAPESLADMIAKSVLRWPAVGPRLAVAVQWLAARCTQLQLGRTLDRPTGCRFPLGYCLVAEKYAT